MLKTLGEAAAIAAFIAVVLLWAGIFGGSL